MKYLLSNANIGGALLALALLVAYLLGLLALPGWMLGLVTLAAYAAGALGGYALSPGELTGLPAQLSSDEALIWLRENRLAKLPPDAQKPLQTILDKAAELLPRIKALEQAGDVDPASRVQLKQTLLRHLPQTIETYLRLPPVYARVATTANGKTPHQLLLEQLHLLADGMDGLQAEVFSGDLNQLLAHSQLLEQKFGKDRLMG
ncbi:hypothetical protein FNU76_12565 [Chitinimonas arctica]|uniref:Uncharacterized protein n=1 Tax=Chitinimonas arctica TaxID=2594795 RepID=A0A516SG35_9NEIS|nr:hypothetical protein [Chitinimonas arctica]QDQ27127.1 hypothetical protein FNU76_12565 [Chitinimonas arctica]